MTTIDLVDTNSSQISAALVDARRRAGSPTTGQVLTLVVAADEGTHYDSLKSALDAAREHPSRILVVIARGGRGTPQLDAEIRIGEGGPGDTIILRLHGQLAAHADSVVLPLLLPDAPVVVWWPTRAPDVPADDPLGRLAQRRLTNAAAEPRRLAALARRSASYRPGDTDLAWTRLTPWRALLAACLDQYHRPIRSAEVESERNTPSAELLAAWLSSRLKIDVVCRITKGPGLTAVRLLTSDGAIQLTRPDGRLAMLDIPGSPTRPVALRRRTTAELLAEELRRLDPDDVYASVIKACSSTVGHKGRPGETAPAASDSASSPATASTSSAPVRTTAAARKSAITAARATTTTTPEATAEKTVAKKVAQKPVTKTTVVKKAAVKKAAVKKAAVKKTAVKKAAVKKTAVEKAAVKKAAVKKTAVKKAAVKKAAVKKAPVEKAPVKKAPVKKAPVKKAPVKKTAVKKTAVKTAPAKKAPVKKAARSASKRGS